MGIIKNINLGIAFILELCLLSIFGYWGFSFNNILIIKIGLALGVVIIVSGFWGLFLAPKSMHRIREPFLMATKLIVFGLAGYVLFLLGYPGLAISIWIVSFVNIGLLYFWRTE